MMFNLFHDVAKGVTAMVAPFVSVVLEYGIIVLFFCFHNALVLVRVVIYPLSFHQINMASD